MGFDALLAMTGLVAGAIASVAGFGIGSLMTPVMTPRAGIKLAVAAVTVAHVAGSALRLWLLRKNIDRGVLLGFGLASAIGGLTGALVGVWFSSTALTIAFGVIVLVAGLTELTGWVRRREWQRRDAWIAGVLSGALGGLVGNQGGIRTAAMLGFDVPKESFVATAAAIALVVDGARLPVYLATLGDEMLTLWPEIVVMTAAVIIGTIVGTRLLKGIPQAAFRRSVGGLLTLLGIYMVFTGVSARTTTH